MTRNIYDDPEFFAGYSRLPRSVEGLDAAAEWPMMQTMLPPMRGRRVVDLGCGFGWFCRWARVQGAASVLGIDVSTNMLARATADTTDPDITYRQADLDGLELPASQFDVAYTSLTLHYLADLDGLLATVRRALAPGGVLVVSVEHPVFTAPTAAEWIRDPDGRTVWPLDGYLREGTRVTEWLAPGVVKHHRTIDTYVNALLRHGFVLTHLHEWGPTAEQVRDHPEWEVERDRPPFLLFAGRVGR
ncbi:MAG: class I SAM-dependent methyltransferase [Actinobacteria bacterium]|nr:class I SAM-dependent methyltransferase [Actinomycetota bacterium]